MDFGADRKRDTLRSETCAPAEIDLFVTTSPVTAAYAPRRKGKNGLRRKAADRASSRNQCPPLSELVDSGARSAGKRLGSGLAFKARISAKACLTWARSWSASTMHERM